MEVGSEAEAMSIGEVTTGGRAAHHAVAAWTPTMNLRFVRRLVSAGEVGSYMTILQQQFQDVIFGATEWRDVPLETEGA
jgi:hypothetical protein